MERVHSFLSRNFRLTKGKDCHNFGLSNRVRFVPADPLCHFGMKQMKKSHISVFYIVLSLGMWGGGYL